jgi:hypothetical protein
MLEGSTIAAILTGILAVLGALATAWMSGWNEQRVQARKNRKALARYSVPLPIAAWDLANWLYDILEEPNYSPQRCKAYGFHWNSQFTSYLLGQYFAGVHIIREMTQFLAHIRGERVDMLKKLLWKIQDEFVSMNYEGRESLEMRWFEGDILAAQEKMTSVCDLDGDGIVGEMRTIGWVEFQQNYVMKGSGPKNNDSMELKKLFGPYEDEFQRIIYRRFKHLYSTMWKDEDNPQDLERLQGSPIDEEILERLIGEEDLIKHEQQADPNIGMVIPDHRVRRLQHLLSDLVELLDEVSTMQFNRPVRRCKMLANNGGVRVPCDCHSVDCNPKQVDFEHRQLTVSRGWKRRSRKVNLFHRARQTPVRPGNSDFRRKTTEKDSGSQC